MATLKTDERQNQAWEGKARSCDVLVQVKTVVSGPMMTVLATVARFLESLTAALFCGMFTLKFLNFAAIDFLFINCE